MKPYGVRNKDRGCCPGHDKFPSDSFRNRKSKKAQARDTQIAHRIARARIKTALHRAAKGEDGGFFDGI